MGTSPVPAEAAAMSAEDAFWGLLAALALTTVTLLLLRILT